KETIGDKNVKVIKREYQSPKQHFGHSREYPKKSTWFSFSDAPPILLGRGKRKTASKISISSLRPESTLKQDLVLTLARLIWIQQELMPKNRAEANEEILKVLEVSTAQLTQEIVKEFAMRDLARHSK